MAEAAPLPPLTCPVHCTTCKVVFCCPEKLLSAWTRLKGPGQLIDNCNGYLKNIVLFALNTGCRKEKILSLEWEKHIDLRHGFTTLDKTKNGERIEIPINDTLKAVLQSITRRLDIPYVFYDHDTGKRYKDIKRSFNTALRRSGIKDFRFHDLRHCFASHLVMAGADLTTVSRLPGHKSLTMTLRYAHLAPNHLKNAVNMLNLTGDENRTAYLLHSSENKELSLNA